MGDVHGTPQALEAMLKMLSREHPERGIVFVGDYVDRGPGSAAVLDLLCELADARDDNVVFLRGNHDQALLDVLAGGSPAGFLRNGGLRTMASYLHEVPARAFEAFVRSFPSRHHEFLVSTQAYFETPDWLVSHAGINPHRVSSRAASDMVTGSHPDIFNEGRIDGSPDLVVCGHYVQQNGTPFERPHLICVDTGCGTVAGAPLTCVLLPERQFLFQREEA